MAGLSSFQGAAAANDAQKAALGAFIAQQGAQGADAYKAEQAAAAQAAKDAVANVRGTSGSTDGPAMPGAPAGATALFSDRASALGNLAATQAGQAGADFGAYSGMLGQANNNYFGAVNAALPIVESVTNRSVQANLADLAAKRDAMNFQREQEQWAREDRATEQKNQGADDKGKLLAAKMIFSQGADGQSGYDPPGTAGATVGWAPRTTSKVISTQEYNTALDAAQQVASSNPDLSYEELQGRLTAILQQTDKKGVPVYDSGKSRAAIQLILAQFANALGHKDAVRSAGPPPAIARPNDLDPRVVGYGGPAATTATPLPNYGTAPTYRPNSPGSTTRRAY